MQIFRPFRNHINAAKYLCDKRLNKQVLEAYQIIRTILAYDGVITANYRYINHPVVKAVYNGGSPYLYDLYRYLLTLDAEFKRRGGNRGSDFQRKIDEVADYLYGTNEELPAYFRHGDVEVSGEVAFRKYREILAEKWKADNQRPKAKLNLKEV